MPLWFPFFDTSVLVVLIPSLPQTISIFGYSSIVTLSLPLIPLFNALTIKVAFLIVTSSLPWIPLLANEVTTSVPLPLILRSPSSAKIAAPVTSSSLEETCLLS